VYATLIRIAIPTDVTTISRLLRAPTKDVRKAVIALLRLGVVDAHGDSITRVATLTELSRRKIRSTTLLREHRQQMARDMLRQGSSRAEIARALNISPPTVTAYLKTETKPSVESPISACVRLATPSTEITSNGKALI
jgi:DNA invertase Pin-like site-specific DNA recombinase